MYTAGRTGLGPMTSREIDQRPTSRFVRMFGAPPRRDRRTGNIIVRRRTSKVVDTMRLLPRFSIRATRVTAARYLTRMRRSHNNHAATSAERTACSPVKIINGGSCSPAPPFYSRVARTRGDLNDFSWRALKVASRLRSSA